MVKNLKYYQKKKDWVKIKTSFDNYIGFIRNSKFNESFKPNNKINKLKSKIFKRINGKFLPTKNFLYFGSGISIKKKNKNFFEFEKNKWVKISDTKKINHHENNFIKIIKLFLGCKYLWGGKTSKGIDCSALLQIYFYYNRIFFPRDSKDQAKFCRRKVNRRFSEGDIIFWKGHVGMCLNHSKFIHAYGPKKKVVIMPINFTIKIIQKTAKLTVKKVRTKIIKLKQDIDKPNFGRD